MGGGDKALIRIGGTAILDRVIASAAAGHAAASSSMPTAIRRRFARYRPCRSSPTACRISPVRLPASSPGSIGRRRMRRASHGSRARRAIVRSCRTISSPACTRRAKQPARRSPARAPATGAIRWSACGQCRCATICAARSSTRVCTRSKCGPRGTASPSPNGRPRRSTPSSTSTRRKTPRGRGLAAAIFAGVMGFSTTWLRSDRCHRR